MSLLISQRERLFAYLDAVLELTDDKYQIQTRPPPPDRASTATSQSQSTTLHQQASQARIKELESKIQAVEMQANIRQVQAKVLEIKIKQIELMVLVKQAQSVMELRGQEAGLLQRKKDLEERMSSLQRRIREMELELGQQSAPSPPQDQQQ